MGRFSTICLVLLAACGDDLEPDVITPAPIDTVSPDDNATALPRYAPSVCASQSWEVKLDDVAVNMSVTTRSDTIVALATPHAGGSVVGLVLGPHMQMTGVAKVDIDGAFSAVTASYQDSRLTSTVVADETVMLHMLDDDLTNPQYAAKMPGRFVADPAFFHTQADLVMPTAGDDGLWLHRFQDQSTLMDSKLLIATEKPATALAAAQIGVATMFAMSTEADCYMMLTSTPSPGIRAQVGRACNAPRIAAGKGVEAIMVFDDPEGVRLMNIVGGQFGGDSRVLRPGTSAPRAVFDGTRYWVSYLDQRGDLVAGYLDKHYQPVTMALGGLRPAPGAYEMVMLDGSPWLFTLDESGYSATRMCIRAL